MTTPNLAVQPNGAAARLAADATHEHWSRMRRLLGLSLASDPIDKDGVARVVELAQAVRQAVREDPDAALYLLLQWAGEDLRGYSASHGLACAAIADLAARHLGAGEEACESLVSAALTMNVSIGPLQDRLAVQASPPCAEQRQRLADHPARSADILAAAGVTDALWLEIVRRHHDATPVDASAPGAWLADLLRRIDIYAAKLGRRVSRHATTTTAAAKGACLDVDGAPDAIGATLLRVVGLYPPGTWVQLRSGEVAVVRRRGAKAHTPMVLSVRRDDGSLLHQPSGRDTAAAPDAIVRAMRTVDCNVRLDHTRMLSL